MCFAVSFCFHPPLCQSRLIFSPGILFPSEETWSRVRATPNHGLCGRSMRWHQPQAVSWVHLREDTFPRHTPPSTVTETSVSQLHAFFLLLLLTTWKYFLSKRELKIRRAKEGNVFLNHTLSLDHPRQKPSVSQSRQSVCWENWQLLMICSSSQSYTLSSSPVYFVSSP